MSAPVPAARPHDSHDGVIAHSRESAAATEGAVPCAATEAVRMLAMVEALGSVGHFRYDATTRELWLSGQLGRDLGLSAAPATLEGALAVVHPEDRAEIVTAFARVLAEGEPVDTEIRVVGPGTATRRLRVLAQGDRDRDRDSGSGEISAVLGVARDVTVGPAKDGEAQLRAILDTVADAIVTIDEDGTIEHVNPAVSRLFGYAEEELIGENVKKLIAAPDRERHDEYLAQYRRTKRRNVIGLDRQVVAARKDGSTFPVELAVSELVVRGQRRFTGILRDVSERRKVEQQQSEFVSSVSHELRTPLTSIRGALGLIVGGAAGALSDEARTLLEVAVNNCERLVRLVNDILDMEKIQSGRFDFRRQIVDLAKAVKSAVAAHRAFASSHRTRLRVLGTPATGDVVVDEDRLAQVLSNLLGNAAKFSPVDADVEIGVERVGEQLKVSVRDHGPGVPEVFRDRLFQRFSQAQVSDARQRGGTGLGLAISKAMVEKMGGEIGFNAPHSGGSVFYFVLPRLAPLAEVLASEPTRPRLLVCEDDPSRFSRAHLWAPAFATIHVAPTVERARALLDRYVYDAALINLVLAGEDASTLLAAARCPSVVVSDLEPDEVVHHLGASPSCALLTRPSDETAIAAGLATIHAAIASSNGTVDSD